MSRKRLQKSGQSLESDETLVVLASKSIASYVRTLQSEGTALDNFRAVALNESGGDLSIPYPADARRGLSIFFGDANCHVCHFCPNFSNRDFHDTGRPFFTSVGQVDPRRYSACAQGSL